METMVLLLVQHQTVIDGRGRRHSDRRRRRRRHRRCRRHRGIYRRAHGRNETLVRAKLFNN